MTKRILTTAEELQQLITEAVKLALYQCPAHSSLSDANTKSYLTIAEAAEYLNLAKQTLYTFTSTRTIPFIRRAKRLLFVKSDLDAWLAEGKKRSVVQLQLGIRNRKGCLIERSSVRIIPTLQTMTLIDHISAPGFCWGSQFEEISSGHAWQVHVADRRYLPVC